MNKWILIVTGIFFTFTTTITGAYSNIKVNNKHVSLNTPIIQYNGFSYVPIRDLLPHFKGTLSHSRKLNHYRLSIKPYKLSVTLKPRRKDILINDTRHYLPSPVLFLEGRLHVPIPFFFKYLGFKVFEKKHLISIIPKKYKTPYSHSDKKQLKQSDLLPVMETDRPLSITYGSIKKPLTNQFFYQQNILFANLIPFFKSIGYEFESNEKGFILSKQHHTIQFFINQNHAISQFETHQKSIYLSASPVKKNNHYYLPVESTINAFFYALKWTPRTRTIHLLSIINDIDFINEDDRYTLQVNATHPISFTKFIPQPWSNGYQLDIPNSKLILNQSSKKLSHALLEKYTIKQISSTTTRLKLISPAFYTKPIILKNSLGLEINFVSPLTSFQEKTPGQFLITSTGPISPKMTILSQKNKIVLDVPYTLNQLPQKIIAKHPGIKQIRTSQFKVSPHHSRIVFELSKKNLTASLEKKDNTFQIQFKQLSPPPKITSRKSVSKTKRNRRKQTLKKSHYSQWSPLKGKLIVIDAGHGGKDPGAVSLQRYKEKYFTLDIAKRVQKKLSKQGATVIMTRRKDTYVSLPSRAKRANRNNAAIFVSIHINSFIKSSVHGTETYYYKYKDRKLAQSIQNQLVKDLKHKNLGIKRARLYVLRHTKMPAVLIEPLFITNPRERQKVKSPSYREKVAQSIYLGIYNYFR